MRSLTVLSPLVVLALAACNDAPSSLLVEIVPVDSADVEGRVRSSDDLTVRRLSDARDLQGDELSYEIVWSVDGTARPELGETVPAAETQKGQVWSVEVTANDGKKSGEPATAEVTILNSPPVAEVQAPSTAVISTEPLEIVGSGTDPDGDSVEMQYYWLNDGEGTPFDGPIVPAAFTYPGEVWTGHAIAFDGEERSVAATVQIEVLNGLPVIEEVSVTEDAVFTDTELVASVIATDPDDQPVELSYFWTVDGVRARSGVDVNTLPAFTADKHQVIELTVTPSDGVDEGEAVTWTTTVQNTPPTTPEVAIQPEEPIPGIDAMTCAITTPSTDTDGDTVQYRFEWTVDGARFTAASGREYPGDTVPADLYYDDETWECTVVPFDDDTDGVPVDITVVPETWSGPREFSTCGATGKDGPDPVDCDSTDGYIGTTLEDEVIVADGIQEWTVPVDGTYRITARGAEGGESSRSSYSYTGGDGAVMRGDFELKRGDVLQIAVGQVGKDDGYSAGGGGATWVMRSDDSPLLIAGGGGGSGYYGIQYSRRNGCDANTGAYGRRGGSTSTSVPSYACSLKTTDLRRGGRVPGSYCGNGGGGIDGDGANDPYTWYGGEGGKSWANGAGGGKGAAAGGFGAGGGGNGSWAGGGGGGYSGGDASRTIGGGGGSYNAGSNQSNTIGNTGDGQVVIDWLGF